MDRRHFLRGGVAAGLTGIAGPALAGKALPGIWSASMRGSIDATELGVRPGALDDQSRVFTAMLRKADERGLPVFLPAGDYLVSNINLPRKVRLHGVPGATRILYGGNGHLLAGDGMDLAELSGLVIDGANRWLGEHAQGLIDLRDAPQVAIDDCHILGSAKNAIALERCGGRIERNVVSGAADAAIYSVESAGLRIAGNTIADCANGGILVHRWQAGADGTIIAQNRIERISATRGGTGQFGNGINLFRADNVLVSQNTVADCAFSAIRANSASNARIVSNTCTRSGETAIYAEFAFEAAVIGDNIVDGAANGISIVNFDHGGRLATCSGNIVRNLSTKGPYTTEPPGFGIGIAVEADTAVTGNVVENAPLYGINIGWGEFMRDVIATGNVIRKAGEGIAVSVVAGAGLAVITDNIVRDTRHGAIIGHHWIDRVTGDMAKTGSPYPWLKIERNLSG